MLIISVNKKERPIVWERSEAPRFIWMPVPIHTVFICDIYECTPYAKIENSGKIFFEKHKTKNE